MSETATGEEPEAPASWRDGPSPTAPRRRRDLPRHLAWARRPADLPRRRRQAGLRPETRTSGPPLPVAVLCRVPPRHALSPPGPAARTEPRDWNAGRQRRPLAVVQRPLRAARRPLRGALFGKAGDARQPPALGSQVHRAESGAGRNRSPSRRLGVEHVRTAGRCAGTVAVLRAGPRACALRAPTRGRRTRGGRLR